MSLHNPRSSLLVAAAVATALAAPPSLAQDTDATLEEIVVTAQKRTENLQDTPIAVSALTGQALEQLNIVNIGAIATQSPSLVYSEAGGEAQLYIRGIGSNIFSIGVDQSVANARETSMISCCAASSTACSMSSRPPSFGIGSGVFDADGVTLTVVVGKTGGGSFACRY